MFAKIVAVYHAFPGETLPEKLVKAYKYAPGETFQEKVLNQYGRALIRVGNIRWVVSQDGELGLRAFGANFWYYKWPDPMIAFEYVYRNAQTREFGEAVHSKLQKVPS